jgi:myo-inositol-1(or 4)-monophosphatase
MLGDPPIVELHAAACEWARLGARVAERFFGRAVVSRKRDDSPVTDADFAVQDAILEAIHRRYPLHSVLGEEESNSTVDTGDPAATMYCWVIDPIDGTRNFARHISVYATSIGVLHNGHPVAGAIHDATTGRVYSAYRDGGVLRDDQPLRIVERPVDGDSTIMISSFRRRPVPGPVRKWMDQYPFRNQGSLCLHLAWVAAGMADAAYALECKLWDLAAAGLLVTEAGGVLTDHQGREIWPVDAAGYHGEDIPILAGSRTMHAHLLPSLSADPASC